MDLYKISGEGLQWTNQQTVKFSWQSGSPSGYHTGIVFRIRHYWEIRKVVNGHKSAADTDLPDGGSGKTCLAGGLQSQ